MKPVVAAAAVAAVVGAGAGFIAGMFGGGSTLFGSKRVGYATILLSGSPGACVAKVFPDVLEIERKYDIDWTVADLCGDTASNDVEIRWIDHPDSGPEVGNDPLESPAAFRKRMKKALKDDVETGDKFRYEIWLNGRRLADPDVEIVMF